MYPTGFLLTCSPKKDHMKRMFRKIAIPVLAMLLAYNSQAQLMNANDIKDQMKKDWIRAKAYTLEYLEAMPADKYSFKAVDSIRSFAQQMLHLASGNIFLMSNATDVEPPAFFKSDIEHSKGAQAKDSVVYYVTASYDYCLNAIRHTDVTRWGEKKKLFSYEETRWALMMKAFEHQGHHRGQTTIYIRLLGIRPPEEKLF